MSLTKNNLQTDQYESSGNATEIHRGSARYLADLRNVSGILHIAFRIFYRIHVVNIYDNSQIQPKRCRKISVPIYALSLHVRQHEDDNTASSGPFNELKLNGNFTIAEVRFFILLILS